MRKKEQKILDQLPKILEYQGTDITKNKLLIMIQI
jgi:hypothetical protein